MLFLSTWVKNNRCVFMVQYLMRLKVFAMLLTPYVKHILPRARWLKNKRGIILTALEDGNMVASLIQTVLKHMI